MKYVASATIVIAAVMLISCAVPQPRHEPASPAAGPAVIEGTVTQLSSGHGNAYTSIAPDQYESLGLAAGERILVTFANIELTLVIGRVYTDVPSGTSLAVLHREGLTFAVRDGNFSRTYGITVGDKFRIAPAMIQPGRTPASPLQRHIAATPDT